MKLTVLGRYAPWAPPGGACSGYLVSHGDTHLLVDGGSGVLARLQEHVAAERLSAVLVTHFHPDHIADLHSLRYWIQNAVRTGRREGPLPLLGPPRPRPARGDAPAAGRAAPTSASRRVEEWDRGHAWVHGDGLVELRPYRPGQALHLGEMEVRFTRTVHPVPCYAISVQAGGRTLFFSADSAPSLRLGELARGANLALVEASLMERDQVLRRIGHMTAGDAAALAAGAGAERLLLTHLYPDYDHAGLLCEARAVFPGAELAQEGRTYDV